MGILTRIATYLQKDSINNKNAILRVRQLSIQAAKKEVFEKLEEAAVLTSNSDSEHLTSEIETCLPPEIRELFLKYQTIDAKESLWVLGRQYLKYIDEESISYPEDFSLLEPLIGLKKIRIGCAQRLDVFCDLFGGHRVFCAANSDATKMYYAYKSIYHFMLIHMVEVLDDDE